MEENEDEKLKDEVALFSDIAKWLGEDNERLLKVQLKCLNCGHKDILGVMIKKSGFNSDSTFFFRGKGYTVFLYCRKCNSCAIALDESEIPKIVAEKLSQ